MPPEQLSLFDPRPFRCQRPTPPNDRTRWPVWYAQDYLRSRHWQIVRAYALETLGHACARCGADDVPLQVHHLHYRTLGREQIGDLAVLCRPCHERQHQRRHHR